jgi:hypothetical protein
MGTVGDPLGKALKRETKRQTIQTLAPATI